MAGKEPIKFGMNDVYRKETGFKPKKVVDGFPQQEHTRFAKQIKMADIWSVLGGRDKVPENLRPAFEKMFASIAGDDDIIEAKELKGFFNKLEKASGKDKMLSKNEAYEFSNERGDVEAIESYFLGIFQIYDENLVEAPAKFIKALFDVNKSKLAAEDKAKEVANNTTVDKNGNSTYKEKVNMEYDGSEIVERRTTKDKSGNVIRIEYYTADNDMKADVYKDGKWVGKVYKTNDGYTYTDTIKDGRIVKSKTNSPEGYWSVTDYYFDKNGNSTKSVEKNSFGTITTDYGDRQIEQYKDGTSLTTYWANGAISKQVHKDKDGNVESTIEFKNNKDGNCVLETHKDGNGKVYVTISHEYDSTGNETKSKTKDASGNVQDEKFFVKGKQIKSVYHNNNGTETVLYKPNGYDRKQEIVKDSNGNTVTILEYYYDAKDRVAKAVTKDASGKVISQTTTEYPTKNTIKEVTTDEAGALLLVRTNTFKGSELTEYYLNGKLYCSKEVNLGGKNAKLFKDASGNVITEEAFWNLRDKIQESNKKENDI